MFSGFFVFGIPLKGADYVLTSWYYPCFVFLGNSNTVVLDFKIWAILNAVSFWNWQYSSGFKRNRNYWRYTSTFEANKTASFAQQHWEERARTWQNMRMKPLFTCVCWFVRGQPIKLKGVLSDEIGIRQDHTAALAKSEERLYGVSSVWLRYGARF